MISYNQLLEHLETAQDNDIGVDQQLFKFRAIIGHLGPLVASDPVGRAANTMFKWNGRLGRLLLNPSLLLLMMIQYPVTCAAYAKENDLLAMEGWHRFRNLAKKDKVLGRTIKESKIRQVRRSQTYLFGYLIHHRIKVHLVFAVKFDGRHKARLVADGHLTPESIENIYSGVVSLRNLRLVTFLGKLNNLDIWGAHIGNAYLEAFTDEKLYIVAGPEFQELEGYILIFLKALYGLKSSGKRWAEVIHGILRDMKFTPPPPPKADPCIWLRKAPNLRCYEYIAVYVDDLCIAAESPSAIIDIFKTKYQLKVKGMEN